MFSSGNTPLSDCNIQELWRERLFIAMATNHPLMGHTKLDWPQLRSERFIVSAAEPGPEVHDYIVRKISDFSTYPEVQYRAEDAAAHGVDR